MGLSLTYSPLVYDRRQAKRRRWTDWSLPAQSLPFCKAKKKTVGTAIPNIFSVTSAINGLN